MPKVATKRKGKSGDETPSPRHRSCIPRETVAAEMPVVTLVVTPEAASHARVSTSSSIETSPPTLSSQMSSQSSNLTNAFYAESSACIKKATSSVVKKKAENINFCDSAQVKSECLKYTKTAAEVPIDQQTQILFLLRKFNTSAITFAFYMLIGKVGGAAPTAFIPLPSKKEDLIQRFLCLIYDTKSMMIYTEEECYRYVKKIHTLNILYFEDCYFLSQNIHSLNILSLSQICSNL
jgi:hypothetical protein